LISPTQRPLPDNTQHSQQVSIPLAGYEPKFPPNERPQNLALDRAATVIGRLEDNNKINFKQEGKNGFNWFRALSNGWLLPVQ
jgi:hypothetical protein